MHARARVVRASLTMKAQVSRLCKLIFAVDAGPSGGRHGGLDEPGSAQVCHPVTLLHAAAETYAPESEVGGLTFIPFEVSQDPGEL